jgi:hypothetical protein
LTNDDNEWLVAFFPSSSSWYGKLVPGEFKHVALFRYMAETNCWVYLDHDFAGIHLLAFPGVEEKLEPLAKALNKCAVLKVKVKERKFVFRGVSTCVSFVKHALGFNRPWVFTPDQLYMALISAGAEHIKS